MTIILISSASNWCWVSMLWTIVLFISPTFRFKSVSTDLDHAQCPIDLTRTETPNVCPFSRSNCVWFKWSSPRRSQLRKIINWGLAVIPTLVIEQIDYWSAWIVRDAKKDGILRLAEQKSLRQDGPTRLDVVGDVRINQIVDMVQGTLTTGLVKTTMSCRYFNDVTPTMQRFTRLKFVEFTIKSVDFFCQSHQFQTTRDIQLKQIKFKSNQIIQHDVQQTRTNLDCLGGLSRR